MQALAFFTSNFLKRQLQPQSQSPLDTDSQQPDTLRLESLRDESNHKIKVLHAFRTITLMLSLVQSPKQITKINPKSDTDRAGLKPLDALAAIAIRMHGTAAVVAKSDHESEAIEVLASSSSSARHPSPSGKVTSNWINFLTTRNPRRGETNVKEPTVVDPFTKIPKVLQGKDGKPLLKAYLEHVW